MIEEPTIHANDILKLDDPMFTPTAICLVTGCSSGIGRATTVAAVANGLHVVGLDIDEEGAGKTAAIAARYPGEFTFLRTDLTREADIEKAVDQAARLGQIRYVANIAGIQHVDAIEDFPVEMYDRMQNLMVRAPFLLAQQCIPHMKAAPDGIGVIGNMASIHAHICTVRKVAYNVAKAALRGLTQSIAAEGEGRIRSFSVSVGFVKTPLALKQIPAQAAQRGISEEEVVRDVMLGKSRVKEMTEPIEVGNLFLFGFSRFSRCLVGGDLLYDGGVVLTY